MTKRSHAKILDFGLAKLTFPTSLPAKWPHRKRNPWPTAARGHLTSPGTAWAPWLTCRRNRCWAGPRRSYRLVFLSEWCCTKCRTKLLPFTGDTSGGYLRRHLAWLANPIVSLTPMHYQSCNTSLTRHWRRICDVRYQHASDMKADFDAGKAGFEFRAQWQNCCSQVPTSRYESRVVSWFIRCLRDCSSSLGAIQA